MTEEELRSLIRKSQRDGFKALFMQYQKYVYTIVWKRLRGIGSQEDAEECVSDVFTRVFMNFDEINNGTLQGYIAAVAERTAIDRYRRLKSGKTTSSIEEELNDIRDDADIVENFDISERNRLIFSKICSLGEPDSTLIIQKYYYERKSADIAKMVGLTPTAARVRLSRALKKLKKILIEENIR